jgi:hypothetical protein
MDQSIKQSARSGTDLFPELIYSRTADQDC